MDLYRIFRKDDDGRDTTTVEAETMPESKSARQRVNEERVFRNIPRQMNAGTSLDSSFDD